MHQRQVKNVFCFIFLHLSTVLIFSFLVVPPPQPCCIASLCRRGESMCLYPPQFNDSTKKKQIFFDPTVQNFPPNSAQLGLGSRLRQNSLCLKRLLFGSCVCGRDGKLSNSNVTRLFEKSAAEQGPPSAHLLPPSLPVSSGAAVLCGRGQQEWDGRRGRHRSAEEWTLREGRREGTVHAQNIPSKEASLQLSLIAGELNRDSEFSLNSTNGGGGSLGSEKAKTFIREALPIASRSDFIFCQQCFHLTVEL